MENIVPQDVPLKQCTRCEEFLPLSSFNRDRSKKDGLCTICRVCRNTHRPPACIPEGYKRCTGCKQVHPATPEYFDRYHRMKDGLHRRCKTCRHLERVELSEWQKQYNAQYQQEHHEKILEQHRNHYLEHRDTRLQHDKQHYAEHREEKIMYQRRYSQTERGKTVSRAHHVKRKMQQRAIEGELTSQQIEQKLKAQHYACYYAACGHKKFEKRDGKYIYHLEHTIPVSRTEEGPRHDINYVVLACPECNSRKRARLPHEWPEGGRLF